MRMRVQRYRAFRMGLDLNTYQLKTDDYRDGCM